MFNSKEYGNYGYTEYDNFYQFIEQEERIKYKDLTLKYEFYSICKIINKFKLNHKNSIRFQKTNLLPDDQYIRFTWE